MKKTILATFIGLLLTGCGTLTRDFHNPVDNIPKDLKKIDIPEQTYTNTNTSINEVEQAAINGTISISALEANDKIPNFQIKNLSLSDASINDALNLISTAYPLSFTIDRTIDGLQAQGSSFSGENISGSLEEVLDKLSNSMGFFYTYHNNSLQIKPDMQFILTIPPVASLMDSTSATLSTLGARNVNLAKGSNMISFTATKPVYNLVSNYIRYIKENRSVITYDTWIYEVGLTDSRESGIQWNKFSYTSGANLANLTGAPSMQASQPLGLSLIFSAGKFSMDALVQFLQSQGNLKTVSQPKLAVLNGEKGVIKAGRKITYVSQVSQSQGTAATPTTSSATTATIQLGTDLTLMPTIDDGTVYSNIILKVDDLNGLNLSTVFGSQIALPDTITREISTTIRSRPGDTIILGGVSTTRDTNNREGVPITGGNALTNHIYLNNQKSELVIILKPQVIKFKGL